MSVRNGRPALAMPGPTTVPDEVLAAMHRPAVDIYGSELVGVTDSCLADLKTLFGTRGRTYIYIANGHGAWEAALSNVMSRGEKVLVLESGRFAIGWGEMATMLGIEVEVLDGRPRRAFDPAVLEARLRADTAGEIKAVLVVQVDTASSVVNDIAALRRAIDAAGHDALFMVDAIASLGTMPFEMDVWGIDVAVTGSQKGLMSPPGLGFVAAQGKAGEAHARAGLRTRYWDWTAREGEAHYMKYCGTPPVHMLFGLRKALDMILAEGLDHVFARHAILAATTRAAVERWSEGQVLSFNITEAAERSNSVTTVRVEGDAAGRLLRWCEEECGVTLGIAIGDLAGKGFRIAHMGHVNAPMMLGTLGVIESGLLALGIPHGEGGIAAAAAHLGGTLGA
ncbi:MAG: aminotransferase class V-fold PLP-dependent enzyme [Proteobacteria bacterium]|nr:aminotransferase class V-fold PLP-dependent enzyme [Pseudomonadota bacterium]MDA0951319.1 aminotransferase class V-fold PLP-dependent enzyme [Pseudomonadota bacterium]